MKSVKYNLGVATFAIICIAAMASPNYYRGEFMPPKEAKKKWGVKNLDMKLFKNGDHANRASMAVHIVINNLFVGKPMKQVRSQLGDPDSYFFSDTIYAYKIMPFPGENKENWHLVFIPDEKLENVKEVKIHKKCCYK